MGMDQRKMLVISAQMEGEAVVIRNIGRKVKVSEMELIALCNLAELGCFLALGRECTEIDAVRQTESRIMEFTETLRRFFGKDNDNGLRRITQACCSLLRDERFQKYIVPLEIEG